MKKLAVIIPVYKNDNPDYVKKSVESILNQSYDDFKLYIAIDGPLEDNIKSLLEKYTGTAIEFIQYNTNKGLATTLNESIKYVKEKGYSYIARMDADDIAHKERLKKQVEYLEANPDVDVLGTQAVVIDSYDKVIGIKDAPAQLTLKILRKRSDIIHPSTVFRTAFFDRVGYYLDNVAPSEDYDLWFRAIKAGMKVCSIQDRLYYFRYDKKLIDRRQNAQKNVLKIKKAHLAKLYYYHLLQHYLIRLTPKRILKLILYRSIKPKKNTLMIDEIE